MRLLLIALDWITPLGSILESLRTRANTLALALDDLAGVTCAPAEGALYLFPRIELPIKAIAAAREAKVGRPLARGRLRSLDDA